jgi:hypothetical protein
MSIVVEGTPMPEQPITETQVETPEVQAVAEPEQVTEVDGNVADAGTSTAKYAGKTMEEVIEMHQHVEQAFGKQSEDVGEQRKLIKTLLEAQNNASAVVEPQEEAVSFEDAFYTDPAQAVNSAIENHPDVLKARQQTAQQEQQQKLNVLEKAYPDWENRVADKTFQEWVGASEIRKDIFRKADTDYRPDYAIELFDMYDKVNMVTKTNEVKKSEKAKVDKALRQTVSETRSTQSVGGKKMYRRSDLINLQITDPNRYASLSDEIQEAYAEGRVK